MFVKSHNVSQDQYLMIQNHFFHETKKKKEKNIPFL